MTVPDRAVVTLATGRPVYLQMAVNLARSFRHWHRDGRIRFAIVTDQPTHLPADLAWAEIISLHPGQFGVGFTPKLHLDEFAPAECTLFIDSDVLCVAPLHDVFDRFAGHHVSVVGGRIEDGEWFGDVARIRSHFGLGPLPKFNGGLYYMERGSRSSAVYDTARSLEPTYRELGLQLLRGKPNDELLMAIAMATHGMEPILDDGTIMADPNACAMGISLDVLGGGAALTNPPPPHPLHRSWNPVCNARPALVHFLDDHARRYPYKREELRLELAVARRWPQWAATAATAALRSGPLIGVDLARSALRPVYRRLFGVRPIAVSLRG